MNHLQLSEVACDLHVLVSDTNSGCRRGSEKGGTGVSSSDQQAKIP